MKCLVIFFIVCLPQFVACQMTSHISKPSIYFAKGFPADIKALCYNKSTDQLIAVSENAVSIFDADDFKELYSFEISPIHSTDDIEMSDNAVAIKYTSQKRRVLVYDLLTGNTLDSFANVGLTTSFKLSQHGDKIYFATSKSIKTYELTNKTEHVYPILNCKRIWNFTVVEGVSKTYFAWVGLYENEEKKTLTIADSVSNVLFNHSGDFSNLGISNDGVLFAIRGQRNIAFVNVESNLRYQEDSIYSMLPISKVTPVYCDSSHVIFKPEKMTSSEFYSKYPDSEFHSFPLHKILVYSLSVRKIVDSISVNPNIYCAANNYIIYKNSYPHGFNIYDIDLRKQSNTAYKLSRIVGFDVNSTRKLIALKNANQDIKLIRIDRPFEQTLNTCYFKNESDDYNFTLTFSRGGNYLLSAANFVIHIWNLDSLEIETKKDSLYYPTAFTMGENIVGIYPTSKDYIVYLSTLEDIKELNLKTLHYRNLYRFNAADDSSSINERFFLNDSILIYKRSFGIAGKRYWDELTFISLITGKQISRYTCDHFTKIYGDFYSVEASIDYFFTDAKANRFTGYGNVNYNFDSKTFKLLNIDSSNYHYSGKTFSNSNLYVDNDSLFEIKNDVRHFLNRWDVQSYFSPFWSYLHPFDYSIKSLGSNFVCVLSRQGELDVYNTKDYQLALSFASYTEEDCKPGKYLEVSPDGYFFGDPEVLSSFTWKDKTTNNYFSYDAFYSTFNRPFLAYQLLNKKLKRENLGIAFYIRIPGLKDMLRHGAATIDPLHKKLCFDHLPDKEIIPDIKTASNGSEKNCPYYLSLPDSVDQELGNDGNAVNVDSSYFKNKRKGNLHLFFVAVSKYPTESGLPPLKNAERAVVNLKNQFINNFKYLKPSFDSVIVDRILIDSDATKVSIRRVFDSLNSTLKKQDCLMIYFIGHGMIPVNSQVFYYFPFDGIKTTKYELQQSGFNSSDFASMITTAIPKRIVFMIDACQSGGVIDDLEKLGEMKTLADPLASVELILSSLPIEKSQLFDSNSYLGELFEKTFEEIRQSGHKNISMKSFMAVLQNSIKYLQQNKFVQTPIVRMYGSDFPFIQ